MKTFSLVRLLTTLSTVAAAGAAIAAVGYEVPDDGFVPVKSRDEVRRELVAAQADGTAASCKIDGQEDFGADGAVGARAERPSPMCGSRKLQQPDRPPGSEPANE